MRIVGGGDEVQRLAHERRPDDGALVQRGGQVLALEAFEPRGERDVGRARALSLERAEPVDGFRNVETDALEEQLARQRGAIEGAQRERLHRPHGTTWTCAARSSSHCSCWRSLRVRWQATGSS